MPDGMRRCGHATVSVPQGGIRNDPKNQKLITINFITIVRGIFGWKVQVFFTAYGIFRRSRDTWVRSYRATWWYVAPVPRSSGAAICCTVRVWLELGTLYSWPRGWPAVPMVPTKRFDNESYSSSCHDWTNASSTRGAMWAVPSSLSTCFLLRAIITFLYIMLWYQMR